MSKMACMLPTWPAIDGYDLEREIGHGGMGVVYVARRVRDGTRVALKVVHPSISAEPGYRRRLRDEARRAATVRHPGIVRVLDEGERAGTAWLVMELVDGPDLQHIIDTDGPLPPARAAEFVAQVADAASAAHAAGLVHGDIKPANILLGPWPDKPADGDASHGTSGDEPTEPVPRARLGDFGLARPLPDEEALGLSAATDWTRSTTGHPTATGDRPGTLAYMAPEQWRGGPVDERTDVYALGATLYTALTGHRPYPQASLIELAYAVATAPPPTPTTTYAAVPTAFDGVVATAMAKDPAHRYQDTAAFARAVRAAARQRADAVASTPITPPAAVSARSTPARTAPARPASARPLRWRSPALIGAALAATMAGTVLLLSLSSSVDHDVPGKGRVVCAVDITLRDHPAGATTHRLVGGDRVTIERRQGAWSYVRANDGARGWAVSEYLRTSC